MVSQAAQCTHVAAPSQVMELANFEACGPRLEKALRCRTSLASYLASGRSLEVSYASALEAYPTRPGISSTATSRGGSTSNRSFAETNVRPQGLALAEHR